MTAQSLAWSTWLMEPFPETEQTQRGAGQGQIAGSGVLFYTF